MKQSWLWLVLSIGVSNCLAQKPNDSTGIPECATNHDCATDRVCTWEKCVDPCVGVCGPNTVCHVVNHIAMCACSPGHMGHPTLGCSNTRADVTEQSGCQTNSQCPNSKACIHGVCGDPCDGLCGNNTICNVLFHVPACACKEGYSGNAFLGCSLQAAPRESLPISSRNKKFYINLEPLDWHQAYISCHKNNSRLASIDTPAELELINKMVVREGISILIPLWTAGLGSEDLESFIWLRTEEQIPAHMWASGEPSGSEHHCVVFTLFNLSNSRCYKKIPSICEYY